MPIRGLCQMHCAALVHARTLLVAFSRGMGIWSLVARILVDGGSRCFIRMNIKTLACSQRSSWANPHRRTLTSFLGTTITWHMALSEKAPGIVMTSMRPSSGLLGPAGLSLHITRALVTNVHHTEWMLVTSTP